MKKIQLTIPEPCHENWDQMAPQEKGRFCGSCQKTVVDFACMSDREIAEFFKKPPSSVCGHFNQDQLDRDIALPKKRIPWVKYFLQLSIPAFLVSAKASAQGKVIMKGGTVCIPSDTAMHTKPKMIEAGTIKGIVFDNDGRRVPFVTVKVVGTKEITASDSNGEFHIKTELNNWLEVSAVGFQLKMVKIDQLVEKTIVLTMEPSFTGMAVLVKTTSSKKKNKNVPIISKIIDTAFKNFKVFPNPAQNNSFVKIDCSKLDNGDYVLSVIDMSGEVLQTQEITIDRKKKQIEFFLEEVTKGAYVVHLFNRKTAASFTEKIIIQ